MKMLQKAIKPSRFRMLYGARGRDRTSDPLGVNQRFKRPFSINNSVLDKDNSPRIARTYTELDRILLSNFAIQ